MSLAVAFEPTARTAALSIDVVADEPTFLTLEPTWNRLVAAARVDHPFLRHEWVRTWWEAFGPGRRLHVLVVREATSGEAVAVAPLMISPGRIYGVPVRILEGIANEHVPRFDFVVARRSEETYRALWEHIAALEGWDVFRLVEVPAGSPTLGAFPRRAGAAGLPVGVWPSLRAPSVRVESTWEEYVRSLQPKHRSNLRNRLRRLERLGAVDLETTTGGEGLPAALDDAFRLEAAAWKGAAGTAIVCHRETEAFYRRLADRAARGGWLRVYFLRVGGRRIAFTYTLGDGRRLYVLKLGYDPEYAPYSPQNLLCFLVLQQLFASGGIEYEFLGGSEDWKREWARHSRSHAWLFVFRRGLRARLLHWAKFALLPRLRRRRLYRALRGRLLPIR